MLLQWLYARDFKDRVSLMASVKQWEDLGYEVIVDDNWEIIYRSPAVSQAIR